MGNSSSEIGMMRRMEDEAMGKEEGEDAAEEDADSDGGGDPRSGGGLRFVSGGQQRVPATRHRNWKSSNVEPSSSSSSCLGHEKERKKVPI